MDGWGMIPYPFDIHVDIEDVLVDIHVDTHADLFDVNYHGYDWRVYLENVRFLTQWIVKIWYFQMVLVWVRVGGGWLGWNLWY